MSNAIVPFREKVATVQTMLQQNLSAIQSVLPKHMTPDRMVKVVNLVVRKNPKLLDCTPHSLIGAVMEASSLGLEPGILGQAYFVPFRNAKTGKMDVQLIAGYKGLIQLCRNTGELSTIGAYVVHAKDKFDWTLGTDPKIVHVPSEDDDPGELRAVYAVARLKDGGVQFEVMFRRDIEKIRKGSRAADSGPWSDYYEEMAKKTAVRRLAKFLPASTEKMHRLVELDEQAEAGIAQDLALPTIELESDPIATEQPTSKLDAIVKGGKKQPAQQEFAEGSDPDPAQEREPGSDDQ